MLQIPLVLPLVLAADGIAHNSVAADKTGLENRVKRQRCSFLFRWCFPVCWMMSIVLRPSCPKRSMRVLIQRCKADRPVVMMAMAIKQQHSNQKVHVKKGKASQCGCFFLLATNLQDNFCWCMQKHTHTKRWTVLLLGSYIFCGRMHGKRRPNASSLSNMYIKPIACECFPPASDQLQPFDLQPKAYPTLNCL